MKLTEIIAKAKQGDKPSIEYLFKYYDGKINEIIRFYKKNYITGILDTDDLKQQCYYGLMKCLQSDCRFVYYYYIYMVQAVQRECFEKGSTIRLPSHVFDDRERGIKMQKSIQCEMIGDEVLDIPMEDYILDKVNRTQLINKIQNIVTEREYDIIYLHHGEGWTLDKIAKKYNLSRGRILGIEQKAFRKIKKFKDLEESYFA